jgi:hypothetical protein
LFRGAFFFLHPPKADEGKRYKGFKSLKGKRQKEKG